MSSSAMASARQELQWLYLYNNQLQDLPKGLARQEAADRLLAALARRNFQSHPRSTFAKFVIGARKNMTTTSD